MSERSWHVRAAQGPDAPALALIGAATFLETFAEIVAGQAIVAHCARVHTAQAYHTQLVTGAKAWLAELAPGSTPIGYALLASADLPGARAGDVELKRIYTLSRFHGIGIGAGLMEAVLKTATGAGRLLLGVYTGNARAIAFYRKQGFAPIGKSPFDVGGTLYENVVLAHSLT